MPDVDLLVRWEIDPGLGSEEPVDLTLCSEFGGERAGKNIYLGKRTMGLTGDFGRIHRDNKNNKLNLPANLKQININGIQFNSIEIIIS